MFFVQPPCSNVTPLFLCARDSWVALLSSPLLKSGSVQHVIEEDAGLLVELSSVAWHRGQLEAPLRFSLSQGSAIRGKGVLWEESLCEVPISVPLNEGHLLHLMLPVFQMVGAPLPAAIGGSLSLLPIARTPLRSLNYSKGEMCLMQFWIWCQTSSTMLLLNPSLKSFFLTCVSRLTR